MYRSFIRVDQIINLEWSVKVSKIRMTTMLLCPLSLIRSAMPQRKPVVFGRLPSELSESERWAKKRAMGIAAHELGHTTVLVVAGSPPIQLEVSHVTGHILAHSPQMPNKESILTHLVMCISGVVFQLPRNYENNGFSYAELSLSDGNKDTDEIRDLFITHHQTILPDVTKRELETMGNMEIWNMPLIKQAVKIAEQLRQAIPNKQFHAMAEECVDTQSLDQNDITALYNTHLGDDLLKRLQGMLQQFTRS